MRLVSIPLVWLAACSPAEPEAPPSSDPEIPRGPGLGNVAWDAGEVFTAVGWVDNGNGVPEPTPDLPITTVKPFGTNTAYLHGGYLVTLFAPDSGFAPGGLLFYDVSDPRDPVLVHRVYEPEEGGSTATFRESHSMAFSHVDGRELVALHSGLGLELWDIADVTAPVRVSHLALPGVAFGDYSSVAWQLAWQGSYVYVAGAGDGLFVVDVSDPTAPVLADRGGLPNPIPAASLGGFRIGPVFVVGNLLVVSSMDNETGYAALDLSDPRHPALLGVRTGLPKFYATCFTGGHVITATRGDRARFSIDDVSDPWALSWVLPYADAPEVGHQLYCGTQDGFVFQGGEDAVYKLDVSDPSAVAVVGQGVLDRPDTDHGQVTAFGNLLWVGNDHGTGSAFMPHAAAPDTTPPAVSFVSPADRAVGQGLRSRVGVTFTDNVIVEGITTETFQVRPEGGAPLAGRFTAQGHIVNFEPAAPLTPGTTYEVVLPEGGVADWAGNPIAARFVSRFTTADVVDPDPDAVLSARIVSPGPVAVGQPARFEVVVDGATQGEASWRFGAEAAWTHRADLGPVTHTFDTPGNHVVIVSLTNGVRRVGASVQITVHRPLPARPPGRSATLAVDAARGLVWTANHDNDSVSALRADTLDRVHEIPGCGGARSVAVLPGGDVWVTCADDASVLQIDGDTGAVARTVALRHGAAPAGIVAAPAGGALYVAEEATGEVVTVDPGTASVVDAVAVGPRPFGLSTDGATLWATRRISPDTGGEVYAVDLETGAVSVLSLPTDTTTVDAEDRARGVPNDLLIAAPKPDGTALWVAAKQDNIARGGFRDGAPLTHETTVRAVLPRIDLTTGQEMAGRRLDLNDRPPPVDVAFTPEGGYAFVALQGADRIAVHDGFTGQPLSEHRDAGTAVQGLAVSPDGLRLYAHHFLSRTVTAHDLAPLRRGEGLDLPLVAEGRTVSSEALDPTVLAGKVLFYRASDVRMSRDSYIACATCHRDGADDGRTWDFTDRGEGLRSTIDLRGRAGMGHGPLHWTANFDEVQDFENDIRFAFGGRGFMAEADFREGTRSDPLGDPKAGLSADLDALAAYVASLDTFPDSPYRTPAGALTDAAVRGADLFDSLACADCHGGAAFTDSEAGDRYDVGTITAASGSRRRQPLDGLDVPTLRGVWATAPYLHDGSAPTLRDVLTTRNPTDAHGVTGPLDPSALDDLVAYLASIE